MAPGAPNETAAILQNLKIDDSQNDLQMKLRRQIDFYLGNSNLAKDKFLR